MMLVALLLLLSRCVVSFDSFEVRNPSLPEDLRKSLSKLSVGQSGHHLTSNYDLDRPWRGDISLFREYEANLASSFQSESAEKSEGDRMLSTPSFSCVKLSDEYDPYKMCSDIVDYSFYLPTGTTLDDLEETVRASVPATFSLMTGACLSDYKKMMCARVYTPCVDNVIPDDTSTYVNGLPYKKPCASLCTSASSLGTTCDGLLEAIGVPMTCTDSSIYDTGSAADSGICNAFTAYANTQVVSDRVEKYAGTFCKDVVDTVYMFDPNMTAGVPGLPDLMPPGEHQKILESTLEVMGVIPRWIKTDCLTDMRKVFCGATYPEPVATEALVPYGFGTCYLGRFTHYSLCTNYLSTCNTVLNEFFADFPAMHLDCNSTVPDTQGAVRVYPENTQVIGEVPIMPNLTVYLSSDPTYTKAPDYFNISSQCPYGFSDKAMTPAEQQPYTVTMLADTPTASDCIFDCPTTYISQDGRTKWLNAHRAVSLIAIPIVIWAMFNWTCLYMNERKVPMGMDAVPQTLAWLIGYVWSNFDTNQPDQPTCASKTVWFRLDALDKAFSGNAGHACALRAYADIIMCFAMFYTFGNTSIEMFLRVVRKWTDNDIKPFKKIWLPLNFIVHHIPLVAAFCLAGSGLTGAEKQAYSGIARTHGVNGDCMFSTGNQLVDFSLFFLPLTVSYFLFISPFVYTLGYALFISYRAFAMQSENVLGKLWNTYRNLLLTGLGVGVWTSNLIFNWFFGYYPGASINMFANWAGLVDSIGTYYDCVVGGFTSLEADPSGGADRCSATDIQRRLPVGNGITTAMCILCFLISHYFFATPNKHSKRVLWSLVPPTLQDWLSRTFTKKESKVVPLESVKEEDDNAKERKSMDADVEMAVTTKPSNKPPTLPAALMADDEETKDLE